jgi:signal transduction histidine kinase
MSSRRESPIQKPTSPAVEGAPFIERVRRALGHDLHTPLGTIANYAAILEYQNQGKPEEVRLFAGRIRSSAMRLSAMLRQMAEAINLTENTRPDTSVNLSALVRSLVTEMNLRVVFPAHGREPAEDVTLDRELLTFAWRSFLSVNAEAAAAQGFDLDLETEDQAITLWIGARPESAPAHVTASKFSDDASALVPPESCFALGLAEWLIRQRGGEVGLWGRPGQSAALRVVFASDR